MSLLLLLFVLQRKFSDPNHALLRFAFAATRQLCAKLEQSIFLSCPYLLMCSCGWLWFLRAAPLVQLPLHTRKASGEVLLLMAVMALSVSHGMFPGDTLEPTKAQNQDNSTKRRQILRRVLRKALQGILNAPGDGTDGASTVMRVR